jgi:hypothetical protein
MLSGPDAQKLFQVSRPPVHSLIESDGAQTAVKSWCQFDPRVARVAVQDSYAVAPMLAPEWLSGGLFVSMTDERGCDPSMWCSY